MTGSIAIPFVQRMDSGALLQVKVDHLVFNRFENETFKTLNVPAKTMKAHTTSQPFSIRVNEQSTLKGSLQFNNVVVTEALQYWFSALNYDAEANLLSGYFHMATSVQDLYTMRVTFQ